MATVKGPLFSVEASGTVASSIVFSRWKGRPVVRKHTVPSNPRSVLQISVRAVMRFLSTNYFNLTATEKAAWLSIANSDAISQINAFARHNADRWTQFTFPRVTPVIAAGTAPVMGIQTLTGGVGQVTVSTAITTPNDIWCMIICASLTTAFTPSRANARFVAAGTATPIAAVLIGLSPGTWFVRSAGVNRGGTGSAFVAEGSAVVT